jgi:hypothetical protein
MEFDPGCCVPIGRNTVGLPGIVVRPPIIVNALVVVIIEARDVSASDIVRTIGIDFKQHADADTDALDFL